MRRLLVTSSPLFFWLFSLATTSVYAQISDSPGSVNCPPAMNLSITVTTEDRAAVIPNALVILKEDTSGQPKSKIFEAQLRTDENGKATASVPCNYFDVLVVHDGFGPVAQKLLITSDANTFSIPLKLYPVTRTTEIPFAGVQPSEVPPLPSKILESSQSAPQSESSQAKFPVVRSGDMPLYPDLLRQARIQGMVRLEVTTDGLYITKVVASGAHKLLLNAAEENIRTWRFYEHRPQTFIVTFVYKLENEEVPGPVNPTVALALPGRVEIRTKMKTVDASCGDHTKRGTHCWR